jgi:hypothetical protein
VLITAVSIFFIKFGKFDINSVKVLWYSPKLCAKIINS